MIDQYAREITIEVQPDGTWVYFTDGISLQMNERNDDGALNAFNKMAPTPPEGTQE